MTCIAAYIGEDGETAIAADSMCSTAGHQFEVAGGKLVDLGFGWTAGCAGAALWRRFAEAFAVGVAQATDENGQPVTLSPEDIPEIFADRWLEWAKDRGHGSTDGGHWGVCGQWLLARRGDIRLVGHDGSLLKPAEGYHAIGSGGPLAMGALWLIDYEGSPLHGDAEQAVRAAVRAACDHEEGCGGSVRSTICASDGLPPEPGDPA